MTSGVTEQLDAAPGEEVQHCVSIRGAEVHYKFMRSRRQSAPLIVRFHGAAQRHLRPLPTFQANLRQLANGANQITICDPTMIARDGFSCSWYAGHEQLDTQAVVRDFVSAVQRALAPSRTVYLGSSSGGFAALYHSYQDAGSVAVVMVPQTNLERHFVPEAVRKYLDTCWPGLTFDEVKQFTCLDVNELYARGFDNTVVYVQSQGDFEHNARQLLPFMNACWKDGNAQEERLIVHSEYWGKAGHGGSVPVEAYLPWVRAAISAPGSSVEDLMRTHFALTTESERAPLHPKSSARDFASIGDLRRAQLVTSRLLESEPSSVIGGNHG